MNISIKKILNSTIILKILSLLIGGSIWYQLGFYQRISKTFTIPLCFYGPQRVIDAPETIEITLQAKRSDIRALDHEHLAAHINSALLAEGPNTILINNKTLFLPETFNVLHYKPSNIIVTVYNQLSTTDSYQQEVS